MATQTTRFRAMVVEEDADGVFVQRLVTRSIEQLPPGELLIRVQFSSLNFKDALSATGHRGVTRHYPHTPGIDAAGIVIDSTAAAFAAGDAVIVTGFDLGMNTPGGFGQYIRVPASWAVPMPAGLTPRESMIYGTAGLTAALSILQLEDHGLTPQSGEVLVTGASGGVGCVAVGILAKAGYAVTAASGKSEAKPFLTDLGAREVISRAEIEDASGKPLLKERWAGVVDSVGGKILSSSIRATRYGGAVSCCGLVASAELALTVHPFILRGVSLLGIDSAYCPAALRARAWGKLAGVWNLAPRERIAREVRLEDVKEEVDRMLAGRQIGRVLVNIANHAQINAEGAAGSKPLEQAD